MRKIRKSTAVLLIIILLVPLIPFPSLNDGNLSLPFSTSELDIDYDEYRATTPRISEVDIVLIEEEIFKLVNDLRTELELTTLEPNDMLKAGAIIRAQETQESFSHTRPNGTEAFTVLNEEGIFYNHQLAGENLAMATAFLKDKEMAQFLFDGWVDSEGHYESMINPEFREMGVGVHFDGEIIYATQLFGTEK